MIIVVIILIVRIVIVLIIATHRSSCSGGTLPVVLNMADKLDGLVAKCADVVDGSYCGIRCKVGFVLTGQLCSEARTRSPEEKAVRLFWNSLCHFEFLCLLVLFILVRIIFICLEPQASSGARTASGCLRRAPCSPATSRPASSTPQAYTECAVAIILSISRAYYTLSLI